MDPCRPKALVAGGIVGVVAPSGLASDARIDAGITVIRAMGYRVKKFQWAECDRHYLAGNDEHRVQALVSAFMDPSVDAIWCLRGGYGASRTAERLDFNKLRAYPKIFIGFSDITALLVSLTSTASLVTFHGPVITQLPTLDERSIAHVQSMLAGTATAIPLDADKAVLRPGRADGKLWGGNLSVLCSLVGTPLLPSFDNTVLFLEDVGEPTYRIDRMLTQLRMSGAFSSVKAVLIGRFTGVSEGDKASLDAVWSEFATWINGPVIRGLPSGHGAENVTLPIGVRVRVDSSSDSICLLESVVST